MIPNATKAKKLSEEAHNRILKSREETFYSNILPKIEDEINRAISRGKQEVLLDNSILISIHDYSTFVKRKLEDELKYDIHVLSTSISVSWRNK